MDAVCSYKHVQGKCYMHYVLLFLGQNGGCVYKAVGPCVAPVRPAATVCTIERGVHKTLHAVEVECEALAARVASRLVCCCCLIN